MPYFSQLLLLTAALVASGLSGESQRGTPAPEEIQAETARLNDWFAARWEEQLALSPIQKTILGRKDDYDRIDNVSERGEDEQLAWRRRATAEMKKVFDYERLTPEARISYDTWAYELERAERALPFRRRGYVFTQMMGPQAFLPQFLISFHKVDEERDMEAYIARIGGVARAVDQLLERARVHAAEGVRPPRFAYEGVLEQARAVIAGEPFGGTGEAPLWVDIRPRSARCARRAIQTRPAGGSSKRRLGRRFSPS
jgi:uncharacterized protein (DUF885 family)